MRWFWIGRSAFAFSSSSSVAPDGGARSQGSVKVGRRRTGRGVDTHLHLNASSGSAADGHVEEDSWVWHDRSVCVSLVVVLVSLGRYAAFVFWGCTRTPHLQGGGVANWCFFSSTEASSFVFSGPHHGKSTQAASPRNTHKKIFLPPLFPPQRKIIP